MTQNQSSLNQLKMLHKMQHTLKSHFQYEYQAFSIQSGNSLLQIWVVSRYYGDDFRMSNLLERIADALQERLQAAVDVSGLFQMPAADAIRLATICKTIATAWYFGYMEVRT